MLLGTKVTLSHRTKHHHSFEKCGKVKQIWGLLEDYDFNVHSLVASCSHVVYRNKKYISGPNSSPELPVDKENAAVIGLWSVKTEVSGVK